MSPAAAYRRRKLNFKELLASEDSLALAQSVMGLPLTKALKSFAAAFDDAAETVKQIKNRFFLRQCARKIFTRNFFSVGSRSFIGNEKFRGGFEKFLRHFKDRGITLDTDKHIRAAMVELNKIGGAIVLDCLTENEIAAIMIGHVEKIFTDTDGKFTITEY